MAEDDVGHRLGELGREARQRLDRAAHAVVAERDLALEPPGVGEVDRGRVGRVRLELADVVQQRAGHGDVAVDARERRADRADGLGDRQAVLEQPVLVGLVVVLGGGSAAVALPGRRALAEQRVEQRAQVRVLDRGDQVAQVGCSIAVGRRAAGRRAGRRGRSCPGSAAGPMRAQLELRAPALMDLEEAADADDGAARADLAERFDVVPDHRHDAAGAVAEREPQERLAVALRALVDAADQQRLVDLEAVCEVADEHVSEGRGTAGRTPRRRTCRRIRGRCESQRVAMSDADLTRTAIVTGGTGGLGAAVVRRLRGDGWRVVVPWVAERELERVERGERPRARPGRPLRSRRRGRGRARGGRLARARS